MVTILLYRILVTDVQTRTISREASLHTLNDEYFP